MKHLLIISTIIFLTGCGSKYLEVNNNLFENYKDFYSQEGSFNGFIINGVLEFEIKIRGKYVLLYVYELQPTIHKEKKSYTHKTIAFSDYYGEKNIVQIATGYSHLIGGDLYERKDYWPLQEPEQFASRKELYDLILQLKKKEAAGEDIVQLQKKVEHEFFMLIKN